MNGYMLTGLATIYRSSSLSTRAGSLARLIVEHAPQLEKLSFSNEDDEFSNAVKVAFDQSIII